MAVIRVVRMSEFGTQQLSRGFTFALTARISSGRNKKRRREKPQSTRLFFLTFFPIIFSYFLVFPLSNLKHFCTNSISKSLRIMVIAVQSLFGFRSKGKFNCFHQFPLAFAVKENNWAK